ncbi:hypothetical protein BU16DRAFT_521976 [Lophium mytilinum]|uniref:Uncharacterized protein n=1 Tax=Lophium mytilinum TaxID=390894 RepID=A0A6A6RIT9_9PEZI|nr:hypothetical protein BU16DRAFT_521976 [Lophium mytilinum]
MIGGASISSRDLLAPLSTPPDISENLYYTKPRIRDVIRMAHNRADPTLPLDALRFLFFLALDPRSSFHPDAFVTRFTRAALLVYVIPARPLRRIENQFLAAVREAEEGDGFEARERYIRTWKADEDGIYHEQRGDEKEVAECLEEVAEVLERAEARDDLEGGETGEPGEGEDEDR